MTIDERIGWLLVGCMVGFILGYCVRILENVSEHDRIRLNTQQRVNARLEDERGVLHTRLYGNIALLMVVAITIWAAVVSQQASNDVRELQKRNAQIILCNQNVVIEALDVLNERTMFTSNHWEANLELQVAHSNMLEIVLREQPLSPGTYTRESKLYLEKLTTFIDTTEKANANRATKPYPSADDIKLCVDQIEE